MNPHQNTLAVTDDTQNALLRAKNITRLYSSGKGCREINFDLCPGEVLGIVGESGSGKTTLLNVLSGQHKPDSGQVLYTNKKGDAMDLYGLSESRRRHLLRTEWGMVHQHARDGLRMNVSAGANIGERLMAVGQRHYGDLRQTGQQWLTDVDMEPGLIDSAPSTFSGGMQQRLQIARNLVTGPRLVFMDEPTGGLDVSVQARLLDLLRSLVVELGLSAIIVTHDLAVARLLAHQLVVMKDGLIIEQGLTDQVLDDPQHPYTQLLVSSVLTP